MSPFVTRPCSFLLALAVVAGAGAARAQTAAPSPPGPAIEPGPPPIQQVPPAGGGPVALAPRPLPAEIPYREGGPVLPGYHIERKPQLWYLISGLATFVTCYGTAVVLSSSRNVDNDDAGVIPLVGPFVASATVKDEPGNGDISLFNKLGFIFVGVGQTVGAGLLVASYFAGPKVLARDEDGVAWALGPAVVGSGAGVSVTGSMW